MRSAEGSITKLGPKRYRIRVTVGYDPATGKQVRKSRTVRGSEAEARRERDRLVRESGGATSVLYGRMAVYDFVVQEWLPTRKLRPTTLAGYNATIKNHIAPAFSKVTLEDLSPLYISRVLARIENQGAALNVYKMLRAALKLAVASGIIPTNPIAGVAKPELDEYSAEVYSLAETIEVLEFVRDREIEPGIIIAATCGLRASETCALDWSDVSLERLVLEGGEVLHRGSVDVYEGYHRVGGERLTTPPKSKRSRRVVAIPAFAVRRLMELRGLGPLMIDTTGQRMTPSGFTSRWRRLMMPRRNKAGELIYEPPVRYIELKNLRHSQSTILLDLGATMHEVSKRDGHATQAVTDRFYNRTNRDLADHSVAHRFDVGVGKVMANRLGSARDVSG